MINRFKPIPNIFFRPCQQTMKAAILFVTIWAPFTVHGVLPFIDCQGAACFYEIAAAMPKSRLWFRTLPLFDKLIGRFDERDRLQYDLNERKRQHGMRSQLREIEKLKLKTLKMQQRAENDLIAFNDWLLHKAD